MFVLKGARIHTASNAGVIENGMIKIADGKIVEIGQTVDCSGGVQVIDVGGLEISPGFIEPQSMDGCRIFCYGPLDRLETSKGMMHPQLEVMDIYNEQQIGVKRCLANGLTTMCVVPYGKMNLTRVVNGVGAIVKTAPDNFVVKEKACLRAAFGMMPIATEAFVVKYKGFENKITRLLSKISLFLSDKFKGTPKKPRRLFKSLLKNYKKMGYEGRNVDKALNKELFTYISADHIDDIKDAIKISNAYDLKLVLMGAGDGEQVLELLKSQKIPCVMNAYGGGYGGVNASNLDDFMKTVRLIKAGVLVSLTANHPQLGLSSWKIPYSAATLVRMGISHHEALKTVTLNSAKALGIEDRVGSLEPGKDADLVIFKGDPLEPLSEIKTVMCNGKVYKSSIEGLKSLIGDAK